MLQSSNSSGFIFSKIPPSMSSAHLWNAAVPNKIVHYLWLATRAMRLLHPYRFSQSWIFSFFSPTKIQPPTSGLLPSIALSYDIRCGSSLSPKMNRSVFPFSSYPTKTPQGGPSIPSVIIRELLCQYSQSKCANSFLCFCTNHD